MLLFASVVATCPDLSGDIRIAGLCYIALRRYEEAIATFQYLVNLSNRHQQAINGLIWAYCSNGNPEEARKLKTEIRNKVTTEYIGSAYFDFGLSVAYLGDLDTAFDALEKAYNDLDPIYSLLNVRRMFRTCLEMIAGLKTY